MAGLILLFIFSACGVEQNAVTTSLSTQISDAPSESAILEQKNSAAFSSATESKRIGEYDPPYGIKT